MLNTYSLQYRGSGLWRLWGRWLQSIQSVTAEISVI